MEAILRARCLLKSFTYSFLVSFEAENHDFPATNYDIPAPAKLLLIESSIRLNRSTLETDVSL